MKRPKLIEHGRRGILHCNVTRHPTSEWVVWQLREAFPDARPDPCAILDRDSKFDADIITFLKATGLKPTASRNVGWAVVSRAILDHVVALNESTCACSFVITGAITTKIAPTILWRRTRRAGCGPPRSNNA